MCFVYFFYRLDLGKSINTDEAAALGAVYQAAYLGKGFKVLTFGVKEANVYPIVVRHVIMLTVILVDFLTSHLDSMVDRTN